jgi:hypothetical protein
MSKPGLETRNRRLMDDLGLLPETMAEKVTMGWTGAKSDAAWILSD